MTQDIEMHATDMKPWPPKKRLKNLSWLTKHTHLKMARGKLALAGNDREYALNFFNPMHLMKFAHAKLSRNKLVWVRDYDDTVALCVAKPILDKQGNITEEYDSYRFWPVVRPIQLREDGSIGGADYVRHWIAVDETEQLYLFMKNFETFNAPL